jgi:hemerythrin superfamily protein
MANGIDLLLEDHRRVEALFEQFEATHEGAFVGQIADALTAHDDAEHSALYPLVGHILGDTTMLAKATLAHSAVKKQLDRLKHLEGQPLVDAVAELKALVEDHVRDEERNVLPKLAAKATAPQLEGLAARIQQTKQRVG